MGLLSFIQRLSSGGGLTKFVTPRRMRSEGYSTLSVGVCVCVCLCSAVHQVGLNSTLRPCARSVEHAKGTYRVRIAKKLSFESNR